MKVVVEREEDGMGALLVAAAATASASSGEVID